MNDKTTKEDIQGSIFVAEDDLSVDETLPRDVTDLDDEEIQDDESTSEFAIYHDEAMNAAVIIKKDPRIAGTHRTADNLKPIGLLNFTGRSITDLMESWAGSSYNGTQADSEEWAAYISDALANTTSDSPASRKLAFREGAEWTQDPGMGTDHRALEITAPRIGSRKSIASGDRALARVGAYCGLGRSISVPLWQSGIWLTVKAPSLTSELELDRRLAADRVRIGRNTRGSMFSNDGVVTHREITDFVLRHTAETSIGTSVEELLKTIKITDLHAMAVALASTIHVNGFPYRQPCVSDIETCGHVEKATINIPKLLWVDNKKISDKQRRIIAKRGSKVSPEELDAYQAEFDYRGKDRLVVNDNLIFVLKVPTLAEHFDVGETWVNDLVYAADLAFGKNMSTTERNNYLDEQAAITRLRSQSHWIDHIIEVSDDDDGVETTVEHTTDQMIQRILDLLSSDTEIVKKIMNGIEDFYAAATVSVVGIPNYECPSCHRYHTDQRGKLNAIHPIDAVSVFFQMQHSRLTKHLIQES